MESYSHNRTPPPFAYVALLKQKGLLTSKDIISPTCTRDSSDGKNRRVFSPSPTKSNIKSPEPEIDTKLTVPPFKLDDCHTPSDSASVPQPPQQGQTFPSREGCYRLDLPSVYHILKSNCFKGASEETTFSPAFENRVRSRKKRANGHGHGHGHGDENCAPLEDGFENSLSKLYVSDCMSEPDMFQSFNSSEEVETDPNNCLSKLMQVAYKVESSDFENNITHMQTPGSDKVTQRKMKSTMRKLCKELKLNETKLKNLELFPEFPTMTSLKYQLSSHLYSDACKQLAFTYWQKGEMLKCEYYLSESHGHFLQADITDKHNIYFCRKDEHKSTSSKVDPAVEENIIQKYHQQSDDLLAFGKDISSYTENLGKLNPDWNIVQITSLFDVYNRFSTSAFNDVETPALFLTCSINIPETSKRSSFLTFIDKPVVQEGVVDLGVMGEFKEVMHKNRSINERYVGERKLYWKIRDEHNTHLRRVIQSMEENWLSPWQFLLPGNVVDPSIRKKIHNFVVAVEFALDRKLTEFQKVALYKLTENCSYLQKDFLGDNLRNLVGRILDRSEDKVRKITERIIKIGSEIPSDIQRHPTILVLDQNLEQLPWDWIPCLRTTSVTRVQSFSLIYALSNLATSILPIDPGSCTYVVNPDGSLNSVQKRLEGYFKGRNTWKGHGGKAPCRKVLQEALQNDHIYLYCGHGSGQAIFPDYSLQKMHCRAIPVLMGCASAQYVPNGPKAYSYSIINSYYIAACPSVVGFLWEITDVECDRVTVDLLERWIPGSQPMPEMTGFDHKTPRPRTFCLATAVRLSRAAATQFLTETGIVNYGLPVLTS